MDIFGDALIHSGKGHLDGGHSGRYPWGSGEDPHQHNGDGSFMGSVRELRQKGLSETEIAYAMNMSTKEYREKITIYRNQERQAAIKEIAPYWHQINPETGKEYTPTEIGRLVGKNESSVRALMKESTVSRSTLNDRIAEDLRNQVAKKGFIDITGGGTESEIGDNLGANVSEERLKAVTAQLQEEGYTVHWIQVEQATNPGKKTSIKVLAPPGTEYSDVNYHRDRIQPYADYEVIDIGEKKVIRPPVSLDSKRVTVRYAEDGGTDKDGVIEIRPGVKDLELNGSAYAQVRIAVDDSHYLKGMAMYGDPKSFPPGTDVIFNTNKTKDVPMMGPKDNTVLKPLKSDPDNPFGATIKLNSGQWDYEGDDGKQHQSPINKVNDEGDWDTWSKTLSSQFLSKQPQKLIDKQLSLSYEQKVSEYEEIKSLTNPVVRKKLLEEFASDCDTSAVDLKAVGLPGQSAKVILPITDQKPNECYCPSIPDGTKVVLVRHPHEGTFQIPELTVNNKNKKAEALLNQSTSQDFIGIHPDAAKQLSGADFDGDTVIVIPNTGSAKVKSGRKIQELIDFDPSSAYPAYPGMPEVKTGKGGNFDKQKEMGIASNLITDMTLKGATEPELVRAVKYSMTVIDAEKHNLDWKQAAIDQQIPALKEKYQKKPDGGFGGASTLISKARGVQYVDEREPFSIRRDTDPETGEKLYRETGANTLKYLGSETRYDKEGNPYKHNLYEQATDREGNPIRKTQKSSQMAETTDARTLISDRDTPAERAYADYANKMKALANSARKEYLSTPRMKMDPQAKIEYAGEVESLKSQLIRAKKNAPRERQAQLATNVKVRAIQADNPDMSHDETKKLKARILAQERVRYDAKRTPVTFTQRQWDAIQKGAVSETTLSELLLYANADQVRKLATPRTTPTVSSGKQARIKVLKANGATLAEIADATGLSTSTVSGILRGKEQ